LSFGVRLRDRKLKAENIAPRRPANQRKRILGFLRVAARPGKVWMRRVRRRKNPDICGIPASVAHNIPFAALRVIYLSSR
jgi:hypothetical protein